MASDQRRDPEREGNRHPDEPNVERRRMHRHVEVLQQRVQSAPIDRCLKQVG